MYFVFYILSKFRYKNRTKVCKLLNGLDNTTKGQKMGTNSIYMLRCLQLAEMGAGRVSPNPMVGCVIVHNGEIIGEGYHQHYGQAHAEVNAISAVKDVEKLPKSTLYVNLEPCAHFGKTPPCADLIIEKRIKKVVIGTIDTHSKVAGKGIEKLKAAGIDVVVGVEEEACRHYNRRFFCYHEKRRPYIVLKWAQTADGFMGRGHENNRRPKKISNPMADILVHKWRAEEDAILVGKNTAMLDNPKLTTRLWDGKNPTRLLIDPNLKVPKDYNIYKIDEKVFVFNYISDYKNELEEGIKIENDSNNLPQILTFLYERNIQSVMVEGGANTLQKFIDTGLWDEARRITNGQFWENGVPAPKIVGKKQKPVQIGDNNIEIIYAIV